jgi:hypothetical protein
MATEKDTRSYEQRIAQCPIHQWTDIEAYVAEAELPQHLIRVFHELILARGEAPRHMNGSEIQKFGKDAVRLIMAYKVLPEEEQPLRLLFELLITQWIDSGLQLN